MIIAAALRRLFANFSLALCALVALVAAVALAVCVPAYAEAASLRLLHVEITQQERQTGRSPFALLFRYVSSQRGLKEWEQVQAVDHYLAGPGLASLGLAHESFARHARTDQLRLFVTPKSGESQFLRSVSIGFISGLEQQIKVVDGKLPSNQSGKLSDQQPLEILMARSLADQLGINVGERILLISAGTRPSSIPVLVTGLWEPLNSSDPAWFFAPDTLNDVLLVPEATFTTSVAATLRGEVAQILWYARLSGRNLNAADAGPLESRIEAVRASAAGQLPGLRLEISPTEPLSRYRTRAAELMTQLGALSAPMIGLVIYFVALVASMLVARQRAEIALLKTRGVRDTQILAIALVEWLILGGLALLIGPPAGLWFAALMGETISFLRLAPALPSLALALTWDHLLPGLVAVAIALVAALAPAALATRRTLVDEQRQAARQLQPPLWQRFYLDLLLLALAGYAIYQLQRIGGLQLGRFSGQDPFANPLLVLVPLILCLALGMLAVRLAPPGFALFARLIAHTGWAAPLIAMRNLARQPATYRGALLLLILTLSLATFSASMATTIEGALRQAMTYQVGAPLRLIETGQSSRRTPTNNPTPPNPKPTDSTQEPRFLFVPVTDHLNIPGVLAAARVGTYEATIQNGATGSSAQLIGIDRLDFPKVATPLLRTWAAGDTLGGLMNRLARVPDGAIVSRGVLSQGLKVGDRLPLQMRMYGDQRAANLRIIAVVDLWPGFYPEDGPLIIANLDYLFDQMGSQYPYDVWLNYDPAVAPDQIVAGARKLGVTVLDRVDLSETLVQEQTQPRRQGLFGLLSVGFITASLLTLIGFLLSALTNARRQSIELGVFQAIGLSGWQVGLALALELALVLLTGTTLGTAIGLLASVLVVPLLQIGAGPHPGTPAYPAQIAWNEITLLYLVFLLALLLALAALGFALGRMRLFQAVKLGDIN